MARTFNGRQRFVVGDVLSSALEAIRRGDLAEGHNRMREFLRQVTISGHLWPELHARELLGEVLARAG